MKNTILIFFALITMHSFAFADYMLPNTFKDGLTTITSVIDATVTGFTKEGYAQLKINKIYLGGKDAPTLIKGISLSCMGGTPKQYGMKINTRYIIFLSKDNLFEEQSYFEVKADKATITFKVTGPHGYAKWFDIKKTTWIDDKKLIALINDATKKK